MTLNRLKAQAANAGATVIVAQDSGAFVLNERRRVVITASALSNSSKSGFFELVLSNAATPGQEQYLSEALMNNKTPAYGGMRLGASIVLAAGRYVWTARALTTPDGILKLGSNVKGSHAIAPLYDLDRIGSVGFAGNSGGYCTVQSYNPDSVLTSHLSVNAAPAAGEEYRAFLGFYDAQFQGMITPETRCVGPAGSARISAYQIYLDNSSLHTFEFSEFQTGAFEANMSVSVSG